MLNKKSDTCIKIESGKIHLIRVIRLWVIFLIFQPFQNTVSVIEMQDNIRCLLYMSPNFEQFYRFSPSKVTEYILPIIMKLWMVSNYSFTSHPKSAISLVGCILLGCYSVNANY